MSVPLSKSHTMEFKKENSQPQGKLVKRSMLKYIYLCLCADSIMHRNKLQKQTYIHTYTGTPQLLHTYIHSYTSTTYFKLKERQEPIFSSSGYGEIVGLVGLKHTHIHTQKHTHTHTHTHIYIYTHTHIYIYIYIYIYTKRSEEVLLIFFVFLEISKMRNRREINL